jgi:hypothetical protein
MAVMKRRLFTILSAISLLLCVAVCVLWVRSYWVADTVMWRRVQTGPRSVRFSDWCVRTIDGYLIAFDVPTPALPVTQPLSPSAADLLQRRESGFYHWRNSPGSHSRWRDYATYRIPLWLLLPACVVIPAFQLHRYRRAARARRRSLSCGYDLRATPDKCPECGTVPAEETA